MSQKNNLLFIVFDSCRFDTFHAALKPQMNRLGEYHRCYSYASWTVPSHTVYMMGQSPHTSPKGVFASEVYKNDFLKWSGRLNIPDVSFKAFVPRLSLPYFLKQHGYRTNALVSMPVLNQSTNINNHFDRYRLMDKHNDFSAIVDELEFDSTQPSFYLINVGETHYPYALPQDGPNDLPRISGVHGVFKHMDDLLAAGTENDETDPGDFFNLDVLEGLKEKQRTNVQYLDGLFEKLYDKVPANTHIIVTSDHGELFGEEGYFGHGPVMHEKVYEVFYLEGRIK